MEVHRFKVGQKVWVRDKAHYSLNSRGRGGYKIEEAVVTELHYHPGRHPFYPHGEGYELDGHLWWSCYPGCRVFGTREEAIVARLDEKSIDDLAEKIATLASEKL